MPKIEANRVYLVARYGETHMGRARFHTQGAWLNVENAVMPRIADFVANDVKNKARSSIWL